MKINLLYRKFLLHTAWWAFYIGSYFVALYARFPDPEWYVIDKGLEFLSNILFFYFFIFVTAKFLFNKKTFFIGIIFFLLNASILYAIEASRLIWAYYIGLYDQVPKYYFQLHTLVLAFLRDVVQFTGYGMVYWFYKQFYEQQKEKLALEQEKHQIEIGFLRGQIHDHFVYNMLNLFHDKAEVYSQELAEGIVTLSDLMRYSVTEYPHSWVSLDEEVRAVNALIDLNQQRFGEKIQIHWQIQGDTTHWKVPHLSILTLVENAFKHGAFKEAPLVFRMQATLDKIEFTTQNAKKNNEATVSTGIGTKNLERRLNLIAEGKAQLTSHEDNRLFYTHLTIQR
ncbi:MAG: sensor histidine kinase [Runella zeae]